MGDSNTISGNNVSVSGHDTGSAIIQVNLYAKTVVDQAKFPEINVAGLQDINKHLSLAQTHANTWLNDYSGKVWDRLQGIVTFGELFGHLYLPLHKAAEDMATETDFQPNEIHKLVSSLQALQSLVKAEHQKCVDTYTLITTYRTDVSADHSSFLTDYNTAIAVLGGTEGEIAQLNSKITSEQDAMSKDLAMIAGGSTMMVVGVLIIVVGALAEIETAGVSTLLIVAGVGVVAGGATMTGIAAKDYDTKMQQLRDDQIKLANDKAEVSLLTHLKGQLTGLNDKLGLEEAALNNLVTAWQQLDNGIGAVIQDLQNPQDYLAQLKKNDPTATPATVSIIVAAELETANDDWQTAVKIATALLDKGRNIQYVSIKDLPTQAEIAKASSPQTVAVSVSV